MNSEIRINAKLTGFANIDLNRIEAIKLTHFQLRREGIEKFTGSFKELIKSIVGTILYREYEYISDNTDCKVLFIYTDFYYREDHLKGINNFLGNIRNVGYYIPKKKKRTFAGLLNMVSDLFSVLIWGVQIDREFTIQERLELIFELLKLKHFIKVFNADAINNKSLVVVYYDLCPSENYIVQLCKKKGVKTATMQHGSMRAKGDKIISIDNSGVQLKKSISDYYLAWNQYTKREAQKEGRKGESIVVCGVPKYVNRNERINSCASAVFGVVLSGKYSKKENLQLIEIANKVALKLNYRFYLRYHPTFKGNEYNSFVDMNYYIGNLNGITMEEYARKVEFTVLSNSSVLVELVHFHARVYRMKFSEEDMYYSLNKCTFSDDNGLIALIQSNNNLDDLYNELCKSEMTYAEFFSKHSGKQQILEA